MATGTQGKRLLGGALLGVGIAVLVAGGVMWARHGQQAKAAAAAEAARSAASASLGTAEEQLLKKASAAGAVTQLRAALDERIDGPTLLDLFQTEDWWQPYRNEALTTRIVSGGALLAETGLLALGTEDRELVGEARKSGHASSRLVLGERVILAAAVRIDAHANAEPVLVLATVADPTLAAAARAPKMAQPGSPFVAYGAFGAGGVLLLTGLVLLLTGGGGASAGIPAGRKEESTLKFGTAKRASAGTGSMNAVGPAGGPASSPARMAISTGMARESAARMAAPIPGAASMTPAIPNPVPGLVSLDQPAADSVKTDADPQSFGRYRLLDRLGEGGMSEIYTAVAYGVEGFSRTFVLKRLRPELAREKEAAAQFFDEAKLQASLVHSNIVPVFDFGKVGDEYFLTTEYIRGRDVVRLLARNYEHSSLTIPDTVAYWIAYETLQALSYAHSKRDSEGKAMGIVHRDISPGNILLSLLGEVKLLDFGIVKANGRRSQTQVGMVKGNANFMSPEQARGHAVDARSDLFSLGLVLHYMLTNQLLYEGDNDLDVLYRAASGPTDADRRALAALPDSAAKVLAKALSFDPADRYQDANSFAAALEPLARGGKSAAAALMQRLFGEELHSEAA